MESGVVMGKNDWNISKGTCAVGSVSNSTVYQDEVVANWYKCNLGKPYNKNFFDLYTTTSYYCSQVVWAGFNTNYGINLNTDMYDVLVFNKSVKQAVHPTELLINDKTVVTYKNNWNY
ncbi:MAG: hypothetical protein ACREV6_15150 [Clostridium sp.]|uniref:hypothetical protein n=1 Tax=Clostridium sp. TaxID=1506 RepID=UPI003D6D888F